MLSLWKRLMLNSDNSRCICQKIRCSSSNVSLNNGPTNVTTSVYSVLCNTDASEGIFLEPSDEYDILRPTKKVPILKELSALEDVSHLGPPIDYKAFNFAAFANESVVLQRLVDLGVDFYYIERKNKNLPTYLLQLDFDKHINPYIRFLLDQKIPLEELGAFFSKNPFFFQNNLDDLQVRINYLQSKTFTNKMIESILTRNPKWLNYSTVLIDDNLGFFQNQFKLKGFEVRCLASSYPKLITWPRKLLTPKIFDLKEVTGFSLHQCKKILLKQPYALTIEREMLKDRLEFMIVDMELPLSLISADPSGLVNRLSRLKERHLFLQSLGRAQYDPKKPNYVSIKSITHGDDATFCLRVAKTSVETFNLFSKSL